MKNNKSLKLNAIANYFGVGYTTVIVIAIYPLYIKYLGAEAFGLVGFFTVLQSWMLLFDMGMSPLLSRQTALSRSHSHHFWELRKLLRSLELIVLILAFVVFVFVSINSIWIANSWLNVTALDSTEVANCIVLMAIMLGLNFFSAIYRSGIQGMESQIQLNVANIVFITAKFVGALLLIQFITQNFVHFFAYQLVVSILESITLCVMFYNLIPSERKAGVNFYWSELKPMLPFAAGIGFTAVIWVLITQLDKILLSSILPLSEYGYFTLVAVIATAILKISEPISKAILPRFTYLLSQGKEQKMLQLYRQSTQLMAVIMLPLSGMIALYSTELIFAWTGDRQAAEWAGPILFWFALGNGILAISAFQYYLQFAHGELKLHVISNSISASIQVPLIIYVVYAYGPLGVAITWFTVRFMLFIIWIPVVHAKFAPGIHWSWLLKDVAPFMAVTTVSLVILNYLDINFGDMDGLQVFSILIGLGLTVIFVNVLFSSASKELILSVLKKVGS